MKKRSLMLFIVALVTSPLLAGEAVAQSLGVHRFQLQPYCNVLTLSVIQQGSVFIVQGFDDQCGATAPTAVVGSGYPRSDGLVGLGLTTTLAAGGAPVYVDASVHVVSFNGAWSDSVGNSGGFVFTPGQGIGGSRRGGNMNGVRDGSITTAQLGLDVLDKLPPEAFMFDESGALIVTNIDLTTPPPPMTPFPVLAWVPQNGILRAGIFTSQGLIAGSASWAGGLDAKAGGTASFAFGDRPVASGDGAVALGSKNGACGAGTVALGVDAHTSDAPTNDEPCGGTDYSNAFVFSDGSAPTIAQSNQFVATATGGFHFYTSPSGPAGNKCVLNPGGGTWACSSDRALKERFAPLDGEDVLRKLASIAVEAWSFRAEPGARHVGPTAQDFRAAFGLGADDSLIDYTDINGINMRAIQALEARTRELAELKARIATLERLVAELVERKQ